MEVPVLDTHGEVVEQVELRPDVFGLPANEALLHQVLVAQQANARVGTAATKTRGMIAGGGKKPWRQKGTGRARAGTTRAPHWRGGGVVFGPHPRSYHQTIPQKMRQAALRVALSSKVADRALVVLAGLTLDEPSTKEMAGILRAVGIEGSALIALPSGNMNVVIVSMPISTRPLPSGRMTTMPILEPMPVS